MSLRAENLARRMSHFSPRALNLEPRTFARLVLGESDVSRDPDIGPELHRRLRALEAEGRPLQVRSA